MASPLQYLPSKPIGTAKETVMNIKAIIASLVLGSSSIAMASPSVTVSANAQASYGTVVRDHRAPAAPPIITPVTQPARWQWKPPVYRQVTLASNLHLAAGRASVSVGAQAGRFNTLQITAATGRTLIKQVYVQFENGQWQAVKNLDRTLGANQTLTVDLDGNRRAIRQVVVMGNELGFGWRRLGGAITLTAA
jgi:hypothetical protein